MSATVKTDVRGGLLSGGHFVCLRPASQNEYSSAGTSCVCDQRMEFPLTGALARELIFYEFLMGCSNAVGTGVGCCDGFDRSIDRRRYPTDFRKLYRRIHHAMYIDL